MCLFYCICPCQSTQHQLFCFQDSVYMVQKLNYRCKFYPWNRSVSVKVYRYPWDSKNMYRCIRIDLVYNL